MTKELGKVVVFEAGPGSWAVDLRHVREVVKLARLTPLPNAIAEVAGMVNVRGDVIPVVKNWWGGSEDVEFSKIMVLEGDGEVIALGVRSVSGIDAILAFDLHNLDSLGPERGAYVSSLVQLTRAEGIPMLDVLLLLNSFRERRQRAAQGFM
jgi:chemotaxis signal transduction protein